MGTEELTRRLKRVEGQVRGLQRMVEERRECETILTQLMAARAALDHVGLLVAHSFIQECLTVPGGVPDTTRLGRILELIVPRFSVVVAESPLPPPDIAESIEEE